MIWYGRNNERYITTRELGKGGEGSVYELQSHHDLVLKRYNESPTPDRIAKLELMVSMRSPAIEAYAAWPVDIVHDDTGAVCGFVMKKLKGHIPLHHVFSPMDRKKMFPDKGYNFLVHVARNVATAFHKLHEAGLVVGDVNEGNILVSASGMVAFIDCDSFQVHGADRYYLCEVGVPRYTPPELLKKKTFENVVRTANTDEFSMAVLIFQLLFLGRHPFAGKNKTSADIDEETAIRQGQFAYSLTSAKKKLTPPPGSFAITDLPHDISDLFHTAFETEERPSAADWVRSLAAMLANMTTCGISKLHSYPDALAECPWCAFRKNMGIMYFLDDSYLQANAALGNIEHFINGFKPQRPELKKWEYKGTVPKLAATPLPRKVVRAKRWRIGLALALFLFGIGSAAVDPSATFVFAILASLVFIRSGWVKTIDDAERAATSGLNSLNNQMKSTIREYEYPTDLAVYNKGLDSLEQLIHEFRRLPDELMRRTKLQEEHVYNEQLDDHLRQFDIESHSIPSIGPERKRALYSAGIRNAAHISLLATTKVPGIGPAYVQKLLDWRRQMSTGFVYIPDNYRLGLARQKAADEVNGVKQRLEQKIRTEYQSLNFLKLNINNRMSALEKQLDVLYLKVKQAEVDLAAFKKIAA